MMPRRNVTERRRHVFNHVLTAANCTSLDCLRAAPAQILSAANKYVLTELPGGSGGATFGPGIGLGPVPDGSYIPDAPTVLFNKGLYNRQVKSMVSGNMAAEGVGLTPDVKSESHFAQLIRLLVPGASNHTVQHIRAMYPYPDSQLQAVADSWTTDVAFACNAQAAAKAYAQKTQRYVFSVLPAVHALDLTCMSRCCEAFCARAN